MRSSRFTEQQMVKILREADRIPMAEAAKKNGVSEATIYAWRKRFGTMDVPDTKRLKSLEAENGRLKKLALPRVPPQAVRKTLCAVARALRRGPDPQLLKGCHPGGAGVPSR